MLTSLISLYITSSIQPNSQAADIEAFEPQEQIINVSNFDFSNLLNPEITPIKKSEFVSPIIEARGALAVDMKTGTALFEKAPHQRMPMASITKLMTILVVLEENDLTEIVTVSNNANNTEGSTMHLATGEQISVEHLLQATLIHSANDAATALAEHNAGSVTAFVEKMNNKALELGLTNTHYGTPTGLDHPENYSSVSDIAKLAKHIYSYKFIKETASIQSLQITAASGQTHNLKATNKLLDSYLNVKGLKTGKTDLAGLCLVAIAENESGDEIITVVLNSPDRFRETKVLVDWIYRAYDWPT